MSDARDEAGGRDGGDRPPHEPPGHEPDRQDGNRANGARIDPDAPGNYVDDETSLDIPEPNEPA